jgi:hypothetical protein
VSIRVHLWLCFFAPFEPFCGKSSLLWVPAFAVKKVFDLCPSVFICGYVSLRLLSLFAANPLCFAVPAFFAVTGC